MQEVSLFVAFGAGFLSFFGPCILPLLPPYFSWLFNVSQDELKKPGFKKKLFLHSLLLVLGFSIFFIVLGAGASLVGSIFIQQRLLIQKLGGLIIIFFGLNLVGLFKGFIISKRLFSKIDYKTSSFLVGLIFAFAWVACFSSVLGAILVLSSFQGTLSEGVVLLSVYSLGLAVPFLLSSVLAGFLIERMNKIKKLFKWVNLFSGLILITLGILLFTDKFYIIVSFIYKLML